jgi:hypothetical protein
MARDLALMVTKTATASIDPADSAGVNGIATIYAGPEAAFESWEVTRVTVLNDSDTDAWSPTATLYRNYAGPGSQLAGTYSGDRDTNSDLIELRELETLVIVWTQIDPASISQVVIEGKRHLKGAKVY